VDRYRGKWETGGSDLDAEAAPEEEAALDQDLNDQIFRRRHVRLTTLERFILGTRRNGALPSQLATRFVGTRMDGRTL
jgi:hypothetical protein